MAGIEKAEHDGAPVSAMALLQQRQARSADADAKHDAQEEHMSYDLARMAAFYSAPLDKFDLQNHDGMTEKATQSMQFLVGRFFALPSEPVEGGRIVHLPPAVTILPREKPIPKPKPLTRWEKYAKDKGIQKKKKDLMVYDDQTKEWKPRFGYKRLVNESDDLPPIIEAGPNDDGSETPWDKKERERSDRIQKQKNREKRNEEEIYGKAHLPQDPNSTRMEKKTQAEAALALAQRSTGSMGKFDTKLKGERGNKIKRKMDGEALSGAGEKARNLEVLSKLVSLDGATLDIGKAANRVSSFMPNDDGPRGKKRKAAGGGGGRGKAPKGKKR